MPSWSSIWNCLKFNPVIYLRLAKSRQLAKRQVKLPRITWQGLAFLLNTSQSRQETRISRLRKHNSTRHETHEKLQCTRPLSSVYWLRVGTPLNFTQARDESTFRQSFVTQSALYTMNWLVIYAPLARIASSYYYRKIFPLNNLFIPPLLTRYLNRTLMPCCHLWKSEGPDAADLLFLRAAGILSLWAPTIALRLRCLNRRPTHATEPRRFHYN